MPNGVGDQPIRVEYGTGNGTKAVSRIPGPGDR